MAVTSNVIIDRVGCWAALNADTIRIAEAEVSSPPNPLEMVAPLTAVQRAVSVMDLGLPEALVLQVAFSLTDKKLFRPAASAVVKGCDGTSALCPTTRPPPDPVAPLFISGTSAEVTKMFGGRAYADEAAAIEGTTELNAAPQQMFWQLRVVAAWTQTGPLLQPISLPDLVGKIITIPVHEAVPRPRAAP